MPSPEPADVGPAPREIALDLCQLAAWCRAVGDEEKARVAVDLAAELLRSQVA